MGISILRTTAVLVLFFAPGIASARAADAPPIFNVWPAKVPGEKGDIGPEKIDQKPGANVQLLTNVSKPTLTLYRAPKEKDAGATVVICPGGGYSILAWDLEGTEVADWLNSCGVNAVILKYRVPARKGLPPHVPPLQDAQRAMSLVRSKAAEWGIDEKRIGMLGFSAGGNLTALACTNYDHRTYEPVDDVDKVSCRPDFGVLIYPAWLVEDGKDQLKPDFRVNSQTPPMFLVHANDDGITAANSAVMYLALKRAGVPAELHIFAAAGHGFGLRPTDKPASAWPQRCEAWMKSQGLLKSSAVVK